MFRWNLNLCKLQVKVWNRTGKLLVSRLWSLICDSRHFIFSIIVENVAEQCVTSVVKTNLLIQSWVLKILFACAMNVMKPSQMMSKSDYWILISVRKLLLWSATFVLCTGLSAHWVLKIILAKEWHQIKDYCGRRVFVCE